MGSTTGSPPSRIVTRTLPCPSRIERTRDMRQIICGEGVMLAALDAGLTMPMAWF
ncbi:hypothetical protein [Ketogulonicigenium vulgare]|uniref:hypothetical protein n=1 Tax=Ketogulonicigenium vulgare TaxID=92945 RepID=UPI00139080CE|nr:hypothetical protein [Ketogulonicigenium vulgare]